MIVEEKKFKEKDGSIGYYEATYDSTNILQTTYFPQKQSLYISFNRGGVYSYSNIPMELYEEFKNAESQGKFFANTIKNQPQKYTYRKEFTLYPDEVKELKEVVEKNREKEEVNEKISVSNDPADENNIYFKIGDEEYILVNSDGFHWKGKLIEDDSEIYAKFKLWLDMAFNDLYFSKENESGIITLLKNVLNFYANEVNYEPDSDLIDKDKGTQARKVIEFVDNIENEKEKMNTDYEKIIANELKNANDPEKLKNLIDSIKNNNENL